MKISRLFTYRCINTREPADGISAADQLANFQPNRFHNHLDIFCYPRQVTFNYRSMMSKTAV